MEEWKLLAQDALRFSCSILLVHLRFLESALTQMACRAIDMPGLMTDGKRLYYNAYDVLKRYQTEKELLTRDYLHIVMHCVFRHMCMTPSVNRSYWNLACDIAVEAVITDCNLPAVSAQRELQQQDYLEQLKKEKVKLTAAGVYRYLTEQEFSPDEIIKLGQLFYADDHELWYLREEEKQAQTTDSDDDEVEADWEEISEEIQLTLDGFEQPEYNASVWMQNLQVVNRERYDYTGFLKRFAVFDEVLQINNDEFDYIFYTYGLQRYKNMPLIEPLEYKEVKRVKEFVIAIDTSGSTSGELVQKFIQKTYNILKSTESFSAKVNLHIIQCDDKVREDVKITTQRELDAYLAQMQIHGLGGTDFRPVFAYVDELIHKKEFVNLKGMIYFTDGFGEFPARKPNYETAIIYMDDADNNPAVPPWAIKLVLRSDEI